MHLGHYKKFSNTKVKPFLLGERNNLYILNVNWTVLQFKVLSSYILNITSFRKKVLVVKDRDILNFKEAFKVRNVFLYNTKWIGGSLTNFRRVRKNSKFKINNNSFNSLAAMRYLPCCVFIFDTNLSYWALREAFNLDIPISAVIDTDIQHLNYINYPIVGNNKSFEPLYLYSSVIKNAAIKGRQKELLKILRIV